MVNKILCFLFSNSIFFNSLAVQQAQAAGDECLLDAEHLPLTGLASIRLEGYHTIPESLTNDPPTNLTYFPDPFGLNFW